MVNQLMTEYLAKAILKWGKGAVAHGLFSDSSWCWGRHVAGEWLVAEVPGA